MDKIEEIDLIEYEEDGECVEVDYSEYKLVVDAFEKCKELEYSLYMDRLELIELKKKLSDAIIEQEGVRRDDEKFYKGLLNNIYWFTGYSKLVSSACLSRGVKFVVGYREGRCCECGKVIHFTNKTEYANYINKKQLFCCAKCGEKIKETERVQKEANDRKRELEKKQEEDLINSLRSMPYMDYLNTDHWKNIRKYKMKNAGYKCELCNSTGKLHVHHKTYANRGKENNSDLIVLCENCHAKFHNIGDNDGEE